MHRMTSTWVVGLSAVFCACNPPLYCDPPLGCDFGDAGQSAGGDSGSSRSRAVSKSEAASDSQPIGDQFSAALDGGDADGANEMLDADSTEGERRGSNHAPTGNPCTFRIKSSGNILSNPGFDGSTAGWSNVALSTDADSCAQSNSGSLMDSGDSANTLVCVPLQGNASSYYFGGKFQGGGSQSQFSLSFWSDLHCSGTRLGNPVSLFPDAPQSNWKAASRSVLVPQGAMALLIQGVTSKMLMDQVYVNTADQF